MRKYFINPALNQYKGQLHTHTTDSDGMLTKEQAILRYSTAKYDFVAFTEHNLVSPSQNREDILILSGIETDCNVVGENLRAAYHIVGVGFDTEKYTVQPRGTDPQTLIDTLQAAGAFVTVAHPTWSMLSAQEIAQLENYDAVEIMNGVAQSYHMRGDSSAQIDKLMSMGKPALVTASDDTHYYEGDFAITATMVVCDKCDNDSVVKALKNGNSYATCGPKITALYSENGKLHVECDGADKIYFISDSFYTEGDSVRRHCSGTLPIIHAEYTPYKTDTHIRVEVIDKAGRKAWSNYISVDQI